MRTFSTYYVTITFFLILLGSTIPIFGQSYLLTTHHFSIDQGLSNRNVVAVVQDERGFIWVSTMSGIDRFDGFQFKNYPNSKYGFREDSYANILIDRNGMLWFANQFNDHRNKNLPRKSIIDIFDPLKEEVIQNLKLPFEETDILSIKNDEQKNIWIVSKAGDLYKYDGQQFVLILQNKKIDEFLIPSPSTIATVDTANHSLLFFDYESNLLEKFIFPNNYSNIHLGKNGNVILLTHDSQSFQFVQYHPNQLPAEIIFYNKENTSFIIDYDELNSKKMNFNWKGDEIVLKEAGEALMLYDKEFKFLHRFDHKDIPPYQGYTSDFFIDKNNNIWLPSINGIFVYDYKRNLFTNYVAFDRLIDTRAITQDEEGNLFVNQESTKRIDAKTKGVNAFGATGKRGIHLLPNGNLITGRYSRALIEYDLEKQQEFFYSNKIEVGMSNVFYQSKKTGQLYLGTSEKGVVKVDVENRELTLLTKSKLEIEVNDLHINCFYENEKGIWVGTKKGFFLFDESEGFIEHHLMNTAFDTEVLSIHEDEDGLFWLGTANEGLFQWNISNNVFTRFTKENGLTDNTIYAVHGDDFGYLWLSSNYGLMRMNRKSLDVQSYHTIDGIPHEEFNRTSSFKGKDGKLYFGGLKGVISVDPKEFQIASDASIAKVPVISSIEGFNSINGKWELQKINNKNQLKLATDITSLRIQFLAHDILNKDKNQFAYSIGNKEDLVFLENNTLELSGLSYGWKEIFIKGKASNEEWSENHLNFHFHRRYPIYVRTTFIIGMICCLGLFTFFYRKRKQTKEKKTEQLIEKKIEAVKAELQGQTQPEKEWERKVIIGDESITDESNKPKSAKEEWMEMLNKKANDLIDDGKFSIPDLAETMNLSERQFRRKLKQHSDMLPVDFMREVRLKKAEFLLQNKVYETVAEVCFAVGFSTPKHFSKLFQKRFGKKPSSYLANNNAT